MIAPRLIGGSVALFRIRAAAEASKEGWPVPFVIHGRTLCWSDGQERHVVVSGQQDALREVMPAIQTLYRGMVTIQ